MLIGYRRSSTNDQVAGYEAQEAKLLATGCTRIFGEMTSSVAQREALDAAMCWVREGDTLCVTELSRLARNTADLLSLVDRLETKGVGLRILDFGGSEVDTKSATGKMLLTMFAAIAEFERALMKERMRAGINRARKEGRYTGRQPTARRKASQVLELRKSGLRPSEIAAHLSIGRSSVYRLLAEGEVV